MVENKNNPMEMQMLQQQMQTIMMQKENTRVQLMEVENAIKEVKAAKSDVFKTSGIVFIKTDKDKLLKELEEKKSDMDIRMKSLEKRENVFKEQIMGKK